MQEKQLIIGEHLSENKTEHFINNQITREDMTKDNNYPSNNKVYHLKVGKTKELNQNSFLQENLQIDEETFTKQGK